MPAQGRFLDWREPAQIKAAAAATPVFSTVVSTLVQTAKVTALPLRQKLSGCSAAPIKHPAPRTGKVSPVRALHIGGLAEVNLCRNLQPGRVVQCLVCGQKADGGRVAAEGATCEGIDLAHSLLSCFHSASRGTLPQAVCTMHTSLLATRVSRTRARVMACRRNEAAYLVQRELHATSCLNQVYDEGLICYLFHLLCAL